MERELVPGKPVRARCSMERGHGELSSLSELQDRVRNIVAVKVSGTQAQDIPLTNALAKRCEVTVERHKEATRGSRCSSDVDTAKRRWSGAGA